MTRYREIYKEGVETYRPLLFSIAYRMLGSASEADDILQEAYLRYRTAPAVEIHSLKSYLTTIVTRLCLDYLKGMLSASVVSTGSGSQGPIYCSRCTRADFRESRQRRVTIVVR